MLVSMGPFGIVGNNHEKAFHYSCALTTWRSGHPLS